MGLIEQPLTEPGRLIITPHPLLVDGQRNVSWELRAGESLYALLMRNVPELDGQRWEVTIGGYPVERHLWHMVRPKHGQVIEVRGGVGRAALAIIAIAVLSYFTMGAGAAWIASTFSVSAGAASAIGAGLFMAGSMLINKVLMPKPPKPDNRQADSVYSISGARNQMRPYEPLPLLFGRIRITPDLLSTPYSWYEGNDQYLAMVLCAGVNAGRVDSLYNADTPLANYEGVQVYHAGYSQMPEQSIPLYSNADSIDGAELPKDHGWVQRTTSLDTLRVQVSLEYVLGGSGTSGKSYPVSERIEVQYRAVGTNDWKVLASETYRSDRFDVRRATIARDVALGQYELRVRKVGLGDYEGKNTQKNDFQWTTLTSVQRDRADYTGIARTGLRIKATGQLNGSPDEIRCIAAADPIPEWNGSEWVSRESSNPGAQCLAYARGIRRGGRLLGGMTLSDSQIDLESWKAFSLHCAANGYTYDHYVKDTRSHSDILSSIARAGFGEITWAGGRLGVIWAAQEQPLSGVVNMATIKKGQFQVDYSLVSAADGIEYTYIDPSDWQPRTLRVPAPGVESMLNPAQISGEGVTSEQHAARLARWHLAQSLYQYKDIAYSTDIEHLSYQRLSVLALQHDMTQWGFGGRVVGVDRSGAEVTITLDEPVPGRSGSSAFIGLRIPGERVYRVLKVKAFSGESRVLTLAEPWPTDAVLPGSHDGNPAHDTIWIYDFKQTPGYRVRVTSIEPEDGLKGAAVRVVPEGPEFWNYVLTGHYVPPANGSSLQTRPVASNLRVTEHQVTQGDTVFTELTATLDISGPVGNVIVRAAGADGELQDVAQTTTRTATWRIPGPGRYTVVARPYSPDGMAGTAVQGTYTTMAAGLPPALVDLFDVEERSGGVRLYTWGWLEDTMRSPDFAGVEIRYAPGLVVAPDWEAMTPVGQTGFHTAPFEAVMPESGQWTFACRSRNTSGVLSQDMQVVRRNLQANLGQVIGGIEGGLGEQGRNLAKEISDRMDADLAEAAARAEGLSKAAHDLAAEASARAQADADAMAAVNAEARTRVDAILNEKLNREADIAREQQIRQSADESLARAVSEVAAGSGTQFDSIKLWPFNQTIEGWTGNGAPTLVDGWLRPANQATAPWVQSPAALAVDGSAYRFVKLRVKRMGTPAWGGLLQWITTADQAWNAQKRLAIPEPAWDVNGVATVDVQDIAWWPATVSAIRLQLGAAQTTASYFLIDYVAVGRPQPGASVAVVQAETEARITGDATEATQRNTLAVQMRGNYTGSDPLQLTSGLVYEELKARVAADSAQVQRISTMEARMPVGTGSLATAASVTSLQETTASTTSALAQSITTINAALPAMIAQGGSMVLNGSWQSGKDVGWTYDPGATGTSWPPTEGRAGGMCVRFDPGTIRQKAAYANGRAVMPTSAGKKYRYSCWYRSSPDFNGSSGNSKMRLANQNGELLGGSTFFVADKAAWTFLSAVYAIPENTSITGLQLSILADNTAGTLWVDDVVVEEVTELLANAQAISDLSTKVTQQGESITSQAGLLTALRSDLTGVSGKTDANGAALQSLTTRVTTAEGKIDSASTSVTRLQSEMQAALSGSGGLFPAGTFEQFPEGALLTNTMGVTYTVNSTGRRNGNRGCDIVVVSNPSPAGNADLYPVPGYITMNGARRLYVEAFAALQAGSVDVPADSTAQLRIGVNTAAAGDGTVGRGWPTVQQNLAGLSKTAWTKISGYITTNTNTAMARLFLSLPGGAQERIPGVRIRLDDIQITDVTDVYAVQVAAEVTSTAVQGLTTRVTQAEGKITAQGEQITDLSSGIAASFNRGENLNGNALFDGGLAPWVAGNANAQNGRVAWVSGGGQQGSAISITHLQGATGSPFVYANGGRWVPIKMGRTGRKMRAVVIARALSGTATFTSRMRVRHAAGEGNADQTSATLTSAWQRFSWDYPVGDERTELMHQVWVTNRGTDNCEVLFDRVELYDVTDELLISANAAATAGLTTTVTQQGSKLDAAAQDLVNLKTQVGDVSATGFNQLKTQVSQQGQAQTAQAQQIMGIQTSLGGKADAAVVQQMDASIGVLSGSPNLLSNALFYDQSGWGSWWSPHNTGLGNKYVANWQGDGGIPWGQYGLICAGADHPGDAFVFGQDVPIKEREAYFFSVYASGAGWGARVYLEFYDAANKMLGSATGSEAFPLPGGGNQLGYYARVWLKGTAPPETAYCRPVMIYNVRPGAGNGFVRFVRPQLEQATPGQNQPGAWNVGGNESRAAWQVNVRSDGKVAGIKLESSNGLSAFDVLSDMFRVSSPSGGQRTEYSDGNWRVYDGSGVLRVTMGVNI
ncbi:host specificity factor TipJ family phage tail protein [uncultured Stenotrophomonas sp.]|uniref:host specificity factor TipJ family phage tail protein n=1 Tax=uncultured Stenotrophomonas sp. TaxID=165438 RepID=UPI0025D9D40A|nr:host specificity factor TipJ family phage tail protein [uncultured Stenotrophomonas sp.]